jgi:hypothetical protein
MGGDKMKFKEYSIIILTLLCFSTIIFSDFFDYDDILEEIYPVTEGIEGENQEANIEEQNEEIFIEENQEGQYMDQEGHEMEPEIYEEIDFEEPKTEQMNIEEPPMINEINTENLQETRKDFSGGFWSSNSGLDTLYLTQNVFDGIKFYDLVFQFSSKERENVLYFGTTGSDNTWEDRISTLTIRTKDGNIALSYLNNIVENFRGREFVFYRFYTDECYYTGKMSTIDPTSKLRNCIVNIDEGEDYFQMEFDDLTDSFKN